MQICAEQSYIVVAAESVQRSGQYCSPLSCRELHGRMGWYQQGNGTVDDERLKYLDSLSSAEDRRRDKAQFFTPMRDLRDKFVAQHNKPRHINCVQRSSTTVHYGWVGSRCGKTNTANDITRIDAYGKYGRQSAHLFSHAAVCNKALGFWLRYV